MTTKVTIPSREVRRLRAALNAVLRLSDHDSALHMTDQATGKTFYEIVTSALKPRKQVRS